MSESVATSLVALATAVIVALWQVGGRGALMRRTIIQELEIVRGLPSGTERTLLEGVARDRTLVYLHRRVSPGPPPAAIRALAMLSVAVLMLFPTLTLLADLADSSILFYLGQVMLWILGGLLGFWVSRAVRLRRVRDRDEELRRARAGLTDPS